MSRFFLFNTMLEIKEEFKKLIPALTQDEFLQLETNCVREGIREPLIIWGSILIDGHNRYKIALDNNLPYETASKEFDNEQQVKEWMILNQFGRRNLSNYNRSVLALELESIFQVKAKENLKAGGKKGGEGLGNIAQGLEKSETRERIAKIADVGGRTISKVKKIQAQATPELKTKLELGEVSINEAYKEVVNKGNIDEEGKKNDWYTPNKYIESARKIMGSIDIDPASSEEANKIVKSAVYYDKHSNGLTKEWTGNIWLNPPYSSPEIQHFINKLLSSKFNNAIVLVNNSTDTSWFHSLLDRCDLFCLTTGRISFINLEGDQKLANRQGQAFFYFGANKSEFYTEFSKYGKIVKLAIYE